MKPQKKRVTSGADLDLTNDLESSGYVAIENEQEEIKRITQLFREQGNKVKRVNIRLTERDVEKARALGLREGIPYATLLTNILHRHLTQHA